MPFNAPYLHEVIHSKQLTIEETWQLVGSISVPFLNLCENIGGSVATAGFRTGNNGMVMLKGTINIPGGTACAIFQLSTRYRPTGSRCFIVTSDTDNEIHAFIVVEQGGSVVVRTNVAKVS